jgi:hypothetical protein
MKKLTRLAPTKKNTMPFVTKDTTSQNLKNASCLIPLLLRPYKKLEEPYKPYTTTAITPEPWR